MIMLTSSEAVIKAYQAVVDTGGKTEIPCYWPGSIDTRAVVKAYPVGANQIRVDVVKK